MYVCVPSAGSGTVNSKTYIYFWEGRDSPMDERAAAAILAKEMDDSLGGAPIQVRKEKRTFLPARRKGTTERRSMR